MPGWTRSVRFRLALVYSVAVFVAGGLITGLVYWGVRRSVEGEPVTRELVITSLTPTQRGLSVQQRTLMTEFVSLEQLVNQRTLDRLQALSLWSLAGLFPLSLLIGWVVSGRALRPIDRIGAVAREIQATDLSRRIELDGPADELRALADTFDDMLDRIEAGVEEQRRFIEDTSHELRNPLAVMATNLDVALADPEADAGSLRRAAEVVRRTVDRTSQRVDELVMYARRDVPAEERAPVELRALVGEVLDEYAGAAAARSLSLEQMGAATTVAAGRDSLKAALGNLVDNAVRLSPVGSAVVAGCGTVGEWAWLGVRDEGPGIAPEYHEAVFRRSWRGSGEPGTAGLGLAIVRQVAEAHGGTVTLTSAEGAGSSFVIWVPTVEAAPVDEVASGVRPVADPLA